jgi:sugar lactone lactonase YvrE
LIDRPELHLLDPFNAGNSTLVHVFPDVLGLLGIVEIQPDQYAIIAGNFSINTAASIPKSYSVWEVDMRPLRVVDHKVIAPAKVRKVTAMPEAAFLNGMTLLDKHKQTVLISDSSLGAVWKLDLNSKKYEIVLQDPTMTSSGDLVLGINGIHLRAGYLYYTSSIQGLFARIPIHSDGTKAGDAEVLATGHFGDDFALDAHGNAYITEDPGSALYRVSTHGLVTNLLNATQPIIAGDTSCAFGRTSRDADILYIVTNGGIPAPVNGVIVGGRVLAYKVDQK